MNKTNEQMNERLKAERAEAMRLIEEAKTKKAEEIAAIDSAKADEEAAAAAKAAAAKAQAEADAKARAEAEAAAAAREIAKAERDRVKAEKEAAYVNFCMHAFTHSIVNETRQFFVARARARTLSTFFDLLFWLFACLLPCLLLSSCPH